MIDLVTLAAPDSAEAEAYRGLRANLMASAGEARVFLVASPAPGAGAAEAVGNLAVVCAQGGKRVILVDADLGHPTLHDAFGVANEGGLAEAIESGTPAPASTQITGLKVLAAGASAIRPSDLYVRPEAAATVEILGNDADQVFILAPPVLSASDAATLARLADGVLLVLAAGHSRRDDAARARAALEQVGADVLGVILTSTAPADSTYRYFGRIRSAGSPE